MDAYTLGPPGVVLGREPAPFRARTAVAPFRSSSPWRESCKDGPRKIRPRPGWPQGVLLLVFTRLRRSLAELSWFSRELLILALCLIAGLILVPLLIWVV